MISFYCTKCLKVGPIVNLDPVLICARHDVKVFVDGELKHHYMPSADIEQELKEIQQKEIAAKVIKLEAMKKEAEDAGEEIPPLSPLLMKPLAPMLQKEDLADVVEDAEESLFVE